MGISTLGAVARAAYHAEHPPAVNAWDAVAEALASAGALGLLADRYDALATEHSRASVHFERAATHLRDAQNWINLAEELK